MLGNAIDGSNFLVRSGKLRAGLGHGLGSGTRPKKGEERGERRKRRKRKERKRREREGRKEEGVSRPAAKIFVLLKVARRRRR